MGYMTLDDFRTDVQSALGDRGFDNPRLDRWINYGYHDLAGSVDFEVLDDDETTATVDATQTIASPANSMVVKLIRNNTSDNLLGWVPKAELMRRSVTITSEPKNWTRHKDLIYLSPVPDGVYSLFVVFKTPPARFTTAVDVSVFPDIWDPAIFQLSVHHALLALGDEQRSVAWLSRAITYIQTRITEADLHAEASGLGASLPPSGANLQKRLASMQGQGG
jgi:hypothetical protein